MGLPDDRVSARGATPGRLSTLVVRLLATGVAAVVFAAVAIRIGVLPSDWLCAGSRLPPVICGEQNLPVITEWRRPSVCGMACPESVSYCVSTDFHAVDCVDGVCQSEFLCEICGSSCETDSECGPYLRCVDGTCWDDFLCTAPLAPVAGDGRCGAPCDPWNPNCGPGLWCNEHEVCLLPGHTDCVEEVVDPDLDLSQPEQNAGDVLDQFPASLCECRDLDLYCGDILTTVNAPQCNLPEPDTGPCADRGGVSWTSTYCGCEGQLYTTMGCIDDRDAVILMPTGETCTPDPAGCPAGGGRSGEGDPGQTPVCGNGIVEAGETCDGDHGACNWDQQYCSPSCTCETVY